MTWFPRACARLCASVPAIALLLSVPLTGQEVLPRVLSLAATLPTGDDLVLDSPVAVVAGPDLDFWVAEAVPNPQVRTFVKRPGGWEHDQVLALPAAPLDMAYDGQRLLISLRRAGGLIALAKGARGVQPLAVPKSVVPGRIAGSSNGRVLVQDMASNRIVEIDGVGKVVKEVAVPAGVTGLAVMPDGGFAIAVAAEGRIVRFDGNWSVEEEWEVPGFDGVPAWPTAIDIAPGGEMRVLDRHGGRILTLAANGRWTGVGSRQGREEGELLFPADLTVLSADLTAVADEGNGRVQVFRRLRRAANE